MNWYVSERNMKNQQTKNPLAREAERIGYETLAVNKKGENMKRLLCFTVILFCLGGLMEIVAQGPIEQNENKRSGGVLTPKQEALCLIAAFKATGNMLELEHSLNTGFDTGLTVNEAREAVIQLYAYCGFPRCLNGLSAVGCVLDERGKQGKSIMPGRNNTNIPDGRTSYDIGSENQRTLFNIPQAEQLTRNAPSDQIVNYYLRARLFGDNFARDILDWTTRELVTISALSAMTGVEGQLRAHQAGGLSAGLTQAQVNAVGFVVQKVLSTGSEQCIIHRPDMIARPGGNENFIGDVAVRFIYISDNESNVSVAYITFEPGHGLTGTFTKEASVWLLPKACAGLKAKAGRRSPPMPGMSSSAPPE